MPVQTQIAFDFDDWAPKSEPQAAPPPTAKKAVEKQAPVTAVPAEVAAPEIPVAQVADTPLLEPVLPPTKAIETKLAAPVAPVQPSVYQPLQKPKVLMIEEPEPVTATTAEVVVEAEERDAATPVTETIGMPDAEIIHLKEASVKKSTRGRKSIKEMSAGVDLIEVPADEELFKKLYYPISKVAEMFKVNQSLIRLWENEFDILKPRKNGKGDRLFRPEDIKNIQLIYHLTRERKYTMQGAKDYIKNNKRAEEKFKLIASLKSIKGFLQELKANM